MSSIALIAAEIQCKMLRFSTVWGPIFDTPRFELMLRKEKLNNGDAIINDDSVSEGAWDGTIAGSQLLILTEKEIFEKE
jgi:hypothetical protein